MMHYLGGVRRLIVHWYRLQRLRREGKSKEIPGENIAFLYYRFHVLGF